LELNPPEQAAGPIREHLARALLNHNDFKGALAALEPLPESVSILVLRAECQWSLGGKETARELLSRAQTLSPDDRPARYLEARWLIEQREPDRAIEILKSLLDVDPHEHLLRYQLALAYRLKGDVDASEKELARMQDSRKKRERLLVLYEKSMREPTNVNAREEIVNLLEQLDKPELAAVWRRAVAAVRPALAAPAAE